ncbi:unnamed protein product [Caenorhabditis nigoni]
MFFSFFSLSMFFICANHVQYTEPDDKSIKALALPLVADCASEMAALCFSAPSLLLLFHADFICERHVE